MKTKFILPLLLMSFLIIHCDSDPCDDGYTQIKNIDRSSYCLPDYVVGEKQDLKKGNIFYHQEHGIIFLKDDKWFDNQNRILNDLNQ
jgi:hypothetical protein